jgi:hypothetical protein
MEKAEKYSILGFTEINSENIKLFIAKIVSLNQEEIKNLPERDLYQIINTFNIFGDYFEEEELWNALEEAIYTVSHQCFQPKLNLFSLMRNMTRLLMKSLK